MRASALEGITPSRAHDFLNLLRDLIELLTGVRPIRFLSYCTAVVGMEEVGFRDRALLRFRVLVTRQIW